MLIVTGKLQHHVTVCFGEEGNLPNFRDTHVRVLSVIDGPLRGRLHEMHAHKTFETDFV